MTAHHAKIPPHVKYLRLHSCINLHTKTTAHAIIQEARQNTQYTPLHYCVYIQTYVQYSFVQEKQESFSSSQTNQKIITSSILVSKHTAICKGGLQSPNGILEHSWRNPSTWIPCTTRPKAPVRYLKFPELSQGPLIDYHPTKRVKSKKAAYLISFLRISSKSLMTWLSSSNTMINMSLS